MATLEDAAEELVAKQARLVGSELEQGYCPRCRRPAALLTLGQAGRLDTETMRGHIVMLASGEARVCFGWPGAAPQNDR